MQAVAAQPWTQRKPPGVRARATMAMPEIETAHHAASRFAKDMATWNPMRVSPDSALLPELEGINARLDDLARNNGVAAGAEQRFVDNVIGPRITCKPTPDRIALGKDPTWAAEWSRQVESLWSSFADTDWFDAGLRLNFHAATRLQARQIAAFGEALALPLWRQDTGSRWFTNVQLVDPARLSNPGGRADTVDLRGGIELDRYGAAVAYHIRKTHPGDYLGGFGLGIGAGEWERVPAYQQWGRRRVLHLFMPERVGQTRGKSVATSVARQFKMYDGLMREKLRQEVLNSLIFAGLETPLDNQGIADLFGGPDDASGFSSYQESIQQWRVTMQGGALVPLPPGTKMVPFTPGNQSAQLDAFSTLMLRYISAGLNMPYEVVLNDFSRTNYSSARASMLEAWRYFSACRQFITDAWCTTLYDLWFEEAVNRDMIPDCKPADYYANQVAWTRAKWIFSGRGWVDPMKEAGAAQMRMTTVTTLADECGEQGFDWSEQLEQRARENERARELGLPLPHREEARVVAAELAAEARRDVAGVRDDGDRAD